MTEQHLADTNVSLPESNNLGSDFSQSQSEAEKSLSQSQANGIIKARYEAGREKGREEGRRQALAELQSQPQMNTSYGVSNYSGQMQSQIQNPSNLQITPEMQKLISEEAAKQAYAIKQQEYTQQVNEYNNKLSAELGAKIEAGKSLYPDYNDVVTPLVADAGALRPYLPLLNQHDAETVQEVLYELGKHAGKVANLVTLSEKMPNYAVTEFNKLVNSIKANKEAKAQPVAREPLSRVTSTNIGVGDGPKTIDELEAVYRI